MEFFKIVGIAIAACTIINASAMNNQREVRRELEHRLGAEVLGVSQDPKKKNNVLVTIKTRDGEEVTVSVPKRKRYVSHSIRNDDQEHGTPELTKTITKKNSGLRIRKPKRKVNEIEDKDETKDKKDNLNLTKKRKINYQEKNPKKCCVKKCSDCNIL